MPTSRSIVGRRLRRLVLVLGGASLAFVSCKDPSPPPASTAAIAVSGEVVELREGFDAPLRGWEHVAGQWAIRGGDGRGVLAQTATNQAFPVTLWKSRRFADVDVTVRFKPISGQIDASGGIVFRARDGSNYYIVRANSLEDNFRLYTVVDGRRRQIAGTQIKEPELGAWHTLRVVAVGEHIQAHLNGRLLIDHNDATFSEGWVGLWTKADAVTEFDDLAVRGIPSGAAPAKSAEPSPSASPSGSATPSASPHVSGRTPWTFEDSEVGKAPSGWSTPVGTWQVETVANAPSGSRVLAQVAASASPVFNVALIDESEHADVDIRVRLRARKGRIDQGGGVVWRATDASNYYIARYNPLEDNYRVYFVKDGRRRQLASADVKLDHKAWHLLRVKMVGDHIECFLNDDKHLDVRDGTFTSSGKIGLWTKADAETEFDDVSFSPAAAP